MKKAIVLLSILLLGQIVLSLYIYRPHHLDSTGVENLVAFAPNQVDQILIEDDQQHKVALRLRDGHWQIPEADSFSADDAAVGTLLSRLSTLQAGWPVATTADAASHFKVADDAFVRRLTLSRGDQTLARLYLGSAPGFRKIYARAGDRADIHSVRFNAFDANAQINDWIDKHPLKVAEPSISGITLPTFSLVRQAKGLVLNDLQANEEMDGDATAALAESLADIPIAGLPEQGIAAQPDDAFEFSLTIQGKGKLDYRFIKVTNGVDYLLSVSDQKRRFLVSATTVDHIKSLTRDKLLASKEGAHAEMPTNMTTEP